MAISSVEIALKRANKILENTYCDTCSIYHNGKVVEDGITLTKEVMLYENIKCRLCIDNVIQPMMSGVYYSTNNKYVVMLPLDINVPLNSTIKVTTSAGVVEEFNSSYPQKLRTHQMVALTQKDGIA